MQSLWKKSILRLSSAVLIPCALLTTAASAQTPTIADNQARGRALVSAAVEAHGGRAALEAARQVRVVTRGVDILRTQSRNPGPPLDTLPATTTLHIDLANRRLTVEGTNEYPGGIKRSIRFITDSAASYFVDMRTGLYNPARYPAAATQTGNTFQLPQLILLAALEQPSSLRSLGRVRLSNGVEVEAVAGNFGGTPVSLGFDPGSNLLRATMTVVADLQLGDVPSEVEFVDYRMLDGMLLPTRKISRTGGVVWREMTYVAATAGYSVPDSLARPPAGTEPLPSNPPLPVERRIADGIWTVGAPGAVSLVVEFRDHLVVVDAPSPLHPEALTRIAALAPGKPIRYVVPTHHHSDHAAGVRHFVALGATILTTPGNRAYTQRLAAAPLAAAPPVAAADVRIETFSGMRVLTDGSRTLELHDIGPSPHASEMVVAWIPEEGLLFQGDLIDVPADGSVTRGTNNPTTQHFVDWVRRKGWDVRTWGGSHGFLQHPDDLEQILAQPLPR